MVEITTAMVLAAGLGTRIRRLDPETPKPLIKVCGRALIDHALGTLRRGGVSRVVVNVHHMADRLEAHLRGRTDVEILISDEREERLETGGGIVKALPLLGSAPFFCTNTDSILLEGDHAATDVLKNRWDDDTDALLLLARVDQASGYQGNGDFALAGDGSILPKENGEAFIFTGLQILRPNLFSGARAEPVSTRAFWAKAQEQGRFRGVVYDGGWMHVGDPEGHAEAERRLANS
ncbi:MAG: nucleotidyltransferase family protein [Pseudomonadota bacterium]